MRKLLVVVDMQNDFITGNLGSPQAQAIVPAVRAKIDEHTKNGSILIYTRDAHNANYLETQEGKHLPVEHCIVGTEGYKIEASLYVSKNFYTMDKPSFGSLALAEACARHVKQEGVEEIEIVGLCTDICVVSNALIIKAALPEIPVTVDAACCAGVTDESHRTALLTMKMCQVIIAGEEVLAE